MPDTIQTFTVTFPDGTAQTFKGPSSMSDADVWARAQQERAFAEKKIPTTFAEGARQSAGETLADNSKLVGAGIGLAGTLTGQPEVVAAAPLIGRATQAAGEAVAGRPMTPTSAAEVAQLGAEGVAAGYGPQIIAKGGDWLAARTMAHQLPNGQWVQGVKGSGAMPWAIRTAGEAAGSIANGLHSASQAIATAPSVAAVAQSTDALKSDLQTLQAAIAAGGNPSSTALKISGGNPAKFSALMTAYMQSRQIGAK